MILKLYVFIYIYIQSTIYAFKCCHIYNHIHSKGKSLLMSSRRSDNIDIQQIFDSNDEINNLSIEELVKISIDEQKEIEIQSKTKEISTKNDLYKKRKDREYEAYWLRQSQPSKSMKNNINSQALYKAYYSLNINETLADKIELDSNVLVTNSNSIGKSIKKNKNNDKKPFYTSRGTSIGTTTNIMNWQNNIIDKSNTNKLLTKNLLTTSNNNNDMNEFKQIKESNDIITPTEPISSNNILNIGKYLYKLS